MNIVLELLPAGDKSLLARLMELYFYELSDYTDADVNAHGLYGYAHLDDYWNQPGRFPYLIRVDGQIAGFALVCPYCEYIRGADARSIGEFFVLRRYRGQGVGSFTARWIFDHHPGHWEVCYLQRNQTAGEFWKKVIGAYTEGRYETCGGGTDRRRGFTFHTGGRMEGTIREQQTKGT